MTGRERFEEWVRTEKKRGLGRYGKGSPLAGHYRIYSVQLAWEAWQQAQQRVPEGWTKRHQQVLEFALRRFINEAWERADEAAQKTGHLPYEAARKFMDDADKANECLAMLAVIDGCYNPKHNK